MDYPLSALEWREHFPLLSEIPDVPKQMYLRGNPGPKENKLLAVVGSRNYSNYGKQVVEHLVEGLRGYPITIVSGLALGIDTLAHESALRSGLHTISVPGSGIDDSVIYPARNKILARKILDRGGALISEFEPTFHATTWSFPQRNRIMAGMSHATLLIEAGEKSGTLITARLATDYNRELLVVPGNIFSENSVGTHQFLKLGATPVTTSEDILYALQIEPETKEEASKENLTEREQMVINILTEPKDNDTIIRLLPFPPHETLILLSEMELRGYIREQNGVFYKI